MKKILFALTALAMAFAICSPAFAGTLCPGGAYISSDGSATTASGPCGAVTLSISNDLNQGAALYWGSTSYGSTGLTVGSIINFNTSMSFQGAAGAEPYYILDFHDATGVFGESSGDKILMLENQSGNVSGNNMLLDPNATLFDVYDDTTGVYLLGQSDTKTLSQWLALYPTLSGDATYVGIGMGDGGTGAPAILEIDSAEYNVAVANVTPEPSSFVLLGTGLCGMAGLLFWRTRKNSPLPSLASF